MKKIIYFLILLFCLPISTFGIFGDGSYGNPFNGPLTANMNWSGTIYINGDVTVNGFTLSIAPGSTLVFLSTSADLIITGTGILNASGTNSSMIRFTADSDNTGTYGGAGETWGHISFENMNPGFTSTSTINYCIIEFGRKDNPSPSAGAEARGGGIHTTFTNLIISNSTIRNNYATYGGGIIVYSNAHPSISNCKILNNVASVTGGGILLDQNPSSRIENCVIAKNTCLGAGGGGGVFIGGNSTNTTFYNCTIASNINTPHTGDNIRLYQNTLSSYPKFYNTIVWGSSGFSSISYIGQVQRIDDFNNCALQGFTFYSSSINLNSTNNNLAGPNFYNVTPGSEDYRIRSFSPCRNNGTSTGAPVTDIRGYNRHLPYDIGAYEAFLGWTGAGLTNSWTLGSNWDGGIVPSTNPTTDDILIPSGLSNYPILNPQDVTIGTSNYFIIEPLAKVTVLSLTNNGILLLKADATGYASLILNSYSGTGSDSISFYLTGDGNKIWHYISPPVTTIPTTLFSSVTPAIRNVLAYRENLITNDMNNGWLNYQGYHYNVTNTAWELTSNTWSDLTAGSGYNYYATNNRSFTTAGSINTGDLPVTLYYNSIGTTPNPTNHGFNLIGNPYTCGIDWDIVRTSAKNTGQANWASVEQAIYFRKNGVQYVYNGVTVPSDMDGRFIAPTQGFFIKSDVINFSLIIPVEAKIHTINPRFKVLNTLPLVRLQLSSEGKTDETVVRFDEEATSSFDNEFDARKIFASSDTPYVSSFLGGVEYVINGIAFPDSLTKIPIIINANSAGKYELFANEITALINYNIYLTDLLQNNTVNLREVPKYSFNSDKGKFTDRFLLTVSRITTGVSDPKTTLSEFSIFSGNQMINIQVLGDDWKGNIGDVKIFDLTGGLIKIQRNIYLNQGETIQIPFERQNGIYLVEITSALKRYVGKVIIR